MEQPSNIVEPKRQALPVIDLALLGLMLVALWLLYGIQGNAEEVYFRGRSAIGWMVRRWSGSGGDLSHGWVIPLISAFAVWHMRRELSSAATQSGRWGFVLLLASLALHWVGYRAQLTRISLLSLILLLWSLPYYFYGWAFARHLLFPCSYLLFCIPMSFLNNITVPLRLIVTGVSTSILNGLGVAAVKSGTAIYSAAAGRFNFDVADACSGLRSLLALTALTAIYAWLTQKSLVKKWLLFLAAIPIAIAGNIGRIVTIAIVAQIFGQDAAIKIYHDWSGFLIFAVAILLMALLGSVLQIDYRERVRQWRCRLENRPSLRSS